MADSIVDLRSDVLATPTAEMWAAMRSADVGWAYLGQDSSVRELESRAADVVGKEAALFVPTCTMANLLALMTLAERGTQVVVESTAHIATTEASGIVYVCGVRLKGIDGRAGALDPATVEEVLIEGQRAPTSRVTLVCLENSHNNAGGAAPTAEQTAAVTAVAHRHGAVVHLDGARLFNSAVALGVPPQRLANCVDTVAFSLNKGLGAPFGAILAGPRAVIDRAHANLGRIGGASIHQAGILAAAGTVALATMIDRLADDNRRAANLADRLSDVARLRVDPSSVRTNIVVVDTSRTGHSAERFLERLADRGVLGFPRPSFRARFVTHRLIGDREVERAAEAMVAVAAEAPGP
jgi:threonine aldolase